MTTELIASLQDGYKNAENAKEQVMFQAILALANQPLEAAPVAPVAAPATQETVTPAETPAPVADTLNPAA